MKVREFERALTRAGFVRLRVSGSHAIYGYDRDGVRFATPLVVNHPADDVPPVWARTLRRRFEALGVAVPAALARLP